MIEVLYLVRNGHFAGFIKLSRIESDHIYMPRHVAHLFPNIHQATCYKSADILSAKMIAGACFLDACDEVKSRPRYAKDYPKFNKYKGLDPTKLCCKHIKADWDRRAKRSKK